MIGFTVGDTTAKGKTDRVTQAVRQYYGEITAYCRCHLNYDRSLAEECAQDVFAAFLQCDAVSEIRHVRAWLYRTADNYLNRYIRQLEKEKKHILPWDEDDMELDGRFSFETDFDRLLEKEVDIGQCVREILSALGEEELRLYTLYFRERRGIDELCRIYGLSSAAMKSRIHRLRLRIKLRIHDLLEDDAP